MRLSAHTSVISCTYAAEGPGYPVVNACMNLSGMHSIPRITAREHGDSTASENTSFHRDGYALSQE